MTPTYDDDRSAIGKEITREWVEAAGAPHEPIGLVGLVSPVTGEVLSLDSPTEDLGGLLADIREHESLVREMKGAVTSELLRRMDQQAKWTFYVKGLELRGASPEPSEEWDAATLREHLLGFVDRGELTIEAVDAAVETIITYKVHKQGINKLRKLGGDIAAVIAKCRYEVAKKRYVSVTRA